MKILEFFNKVVEDLQDLPAEALQWILIILLAPSLLLLILPLLMRVV